MLLRRGLVGSVLLACVLGIIFLAVDAKRQIHEGTVANSDALQWTLSQLDVELLTLDVAVHDAMQHGSERRPHPALDEIRTRFDVFYSRIMMLGNGSLFLRLQDDPQFARNHQRLRNFLAETTPLIDGSDEVLIASLPILDAKLKALRKPSRAMALAGLRVYAEISEANRLAVGRTLLLLAGLTLVFILMLLTMLIVVYRLDASNRARTAEVEAGAARLRAIVGTAQDAIITLDARGRVVDCNAAAARLFRDDAARAHGAELAQILFDPAHRGVLQGAIARALDRGSAPDDSGRLRLTARDADGRRFPVEVSVSATRPGEGPRLVVVFLRDLTAQVAAEAALVQARDEALAGERAKSDLLAVMSHEVRTPLNGLLGTLELLAQTRLSAQQKDYLRILETSGRLLLHHVNDVLDISRLDSGLMQTNPCPLDLGELCLEVIENQRARAAAQGNQITLELPPDGRLGLIADGRLLNQVLLNLVSNAVKFTEAGQITLSVRHLGPDGPTEFRITDTGIGIAPEDLPRIFDDFVTLDPSYARRQGGTGLGLGIAQRIVAALGGALEAESVPGRGSTFHFALTLPILGTAQDAATPMAPLSPHEPARPRGLSVLVIEDNAINRRVLIEMLVRAGHRVTAAEDGAEGLRRAGEARFDAILMDVSMPGMDGLAATDAIRAVAGPNQATPILALTAHALPQEQATFLAHGMTDVLIKPVSGEGLAQALARAAASNVRAPLRRKPVARVPDGLAHVVPAFLAEGAQALAEIRNLADQPQAAAGLQRTVHRLAGSAGLIGAGLLARKLGRIETALKLGDARRAQAEIAGLAAIWVQTVADLRSATPAQAPCVVRTA